MSALKQLQKAVKWDNRANAAIHIVSNLKSILKYKNYIIIGLTLVYNLTIRSPQMSFRSAIEKFSLSQLVFEELERMLWDDPSKEVREAVSKTIASLGMLNKTLGVVVR